MCPFYTQTLSLEVMVSYDQLRSHLCFSLSLDRKDPAMVLISQSSGVHSPVSLDFPLPAIQGVPPHYKSLILSC